MTALRVIKLGGSLLGRTDLRPRFDEWLASQRPAKNLIVVGGGSLVEAIRELHHVHRFSAATCHELAIDAMSVTARLVAELLDLPRLTKLDEARETLRAAAVFDVRDTVWHEEPKTPGIRLEIGWHVTSDSIAARIAQMLGASELVLLKSAPPPSQDIAALAAQGYVDEFFPRIACELPAVRFVNLSRW
jgi:aspartokinase-like uncharacterized kinase